MLPPRVKTPTVVTPSRGPACFTDDFPPCFWMANSVSPLRRSTVIWFGSLEFISTSFVYDMILLSTRGPGGARIVRLRSGRMTCRTHHHTSPPKRRRDQHHHRRSMIAARSPPRADHLELLVGDPSGLCSWITNGPTNYSSNNGFAALREPNSMAMEPVTSPSSTACCGFAS